MHPRVQVRSIEQLWITTDRMVGSRKHLRSTLNLITRPSLLDDPDLPDDDDEDSDGEDTWP